MFDGFYGDCFDFTRFDLPGINSYVLRLKWFGAVDVNGSGLKFGDTAASSQDICSVV